MVHTPYVPRTETMPMIPPTKPRAPRTPSDPESLALSGIQRLLRPLTEAQRARVLAFVNSKFASTPGAE